MDITRLRTETTFSTPTDGELVMSCVIPAPAGVVFDAWTRAEHLPHWLLGPEGWSMPVCEIDLRPGGAWRFGWRRTDGSEMELRGVYREVARPGRLVSTELWGGAWPQTLNTLLLSEEQGRTTVRNTVLYPSKAARDAAMATGMEKGVARSYERLGAYARALA